MRSVIVTPMGTGWAVRCEGVENDMLFRSGAKAEAAARQFAEALAEGGDAVQIHIQLRDGASAARFLCVPAVTEANRGLLDGAPATPLQTV
jgi:hypothetical protein